MILRVGFKNNGVVSWYMGVWLKSRIWSKLLCCLKSDTTYILYFGPHTVIISQNWLHFTTQCNPTYPNSFITLCRIQCRIFHQQLHNRQFTLWWKIDVIQLYHISLTRVMAFSLTSLDVHLNLYGCYNCSTKIIFYQQLFYIHIAAYLTFHNNLVHKKSSTKYNLSYRNITLQTA